jgi:hypothetical protein
MSAHTSPRHWLRRSLDGIWDSIRLFGAAECGACPDDEAPSKRRATTNTAQRRPTTGMQVAPG